MKRRWAVLAGVLLSLFLLSCRDDSTPTAPDSSPSLAKVGTTPALAAEGRCVREATYVVRTEAELNAALGVAAYGDVIALDGMIPLAKEDTVAVAGVTLTCFSPGSGVYSEATPDPWDFTLVILAPDVTVTGLVLDGRAVKRGTVFFGPDERIGIYPVPLRFLDNRVICPSWGPLGEGLCLWGAGAAGSVVGDNHFQGMGSQAGVWLQYVSWTLNPEEPPVFVGIDGTRVEGNTLEQMAMPPTSGPLAAGIRVTGGRDVVVQGNLIRGPWPNGIGPANLTNSLIRSNTIEGPINWGIGFDANTLGEGGRDNTIQGNRITGTGRGGIVVRQSCNQEFLGNNLSKAGGEVGDVWYWVGTGGNVLRGYHGRVLDEGARDCDSDGVVDPNTVVGSSGNGR